MKTDFLPDEEYILNQMHKVSSHHKAAIIMSNRAGCFHCLCVFNVEEIREWTDNDRTALCPVCGSDSVLSDSEDQLCVNLEFLSDMKKKFFSNGTKTKNKSFLDLVNTTNFPKVLN